MLTKGDDFPIHQLPEPIATAGSDRNFYDRYFFNGYDRDGTVFFACALGVYPHLNIMDAAFSVVRGGVQRNLRASRVLHMERMDTVVGPIAVDVLEPLETLRLRINSPEHGIKAELTFRHRHSPIHEPRFTHRIGPRMLLDYTRLTQNGTWDGWIEMEGERLTLGADATWGTRDRSWGVRPIGLADPQPVAPPPMPQFYWLWSPLNFEDHCVFYHINSDAEGKPWNTKGILVPLHGDTQEPMVAASSHLAFTPGTRHASAAELHLQCPQHGRIAIHLTPQWHFSMSGVGYMHPEWGHGQYKGDLAVSFDQFDHATVDPMDVLHLHIQAFCKADMRTENGLVRSGVGVLEQLILGPHAPSGFTDLLDPATAGGR